MASDNHWPELIINRGFSDTEFNEWVKQNKFFVGEDLQDVQYWTSCIPYELRLLLDAKQALGQTTSLEDVLEKYKFDRHRQLMAQQQVFYEEHIKGSTRFEEHALNAVTLMMLEIRYSTFDQFYKLNQQLMFEEDGYIRSTTPLARKLLSSFWRELGGAMDKLTQIVFKAPVKEISADVKGRTLEKYIQRQLAQNKTVKWYIFKIDSKSAPVHWKRIQIFIEDPRVVYFDGNKLPSKVNWSESIIFIPTSPNYPDVDVFLWSPASKTLHPVQITVVDPISKHSRNFFTFKASGKPADLWRAKSGNAIKDVQFIWLGTNRNVAHSGFDNDYLLTLDDLVKQEPTMFPLLPDLVLC